VSTSTLKQSLSPSEFAFVLQKVELKADKIEWLGKCDNGKGKYPLSKKGQSMESLRERLHLRPRTNLIGAVARIRNALAHATHTFFQSRGFIYVHTPLITTSDCEGAGEMFQVRCCSLFSLFAKHCTFIYICVSVSMLVLLTNRHGFDKWVATYIAA